NQPLADDMVGVFLKAPLATPELAQTAFGRLRSDLLKCLTTCPIPLAATLDMPTAERFAIAISCQIDNTQIDTQDTLCIERFGCLNLATDKQIPFSTDERQIGFAALCDQQPSLSLATDERN